MINVCVKERSVDKMCKYRSDLEIDDLLDGRSISFVAKEIGMGREKLSLILRCELDCSESDAFRIVNRCDKGALIEDYFVLVTKEGC